MRKNCSKIKVVSKNHKTMLLRIAKELNVLGIAISNRGPVEGFNVLGVKKGNPARGQADIQQDLHAGCKSAS